MTNESALCEVAAESAPLRFAVLCDSTVLSAWQAHCLELLIAEPGVIPVLVIVNAEDSNPTSEAAKVRRLLTGELGLWEIFRRFHVRRRARSVRPVDMTEAFKDVPRMSCQVVRKGKFSEYFQDSDIETIKAHDLDFILRFSFGIIRGEILKVARHGVWSFHHDDEQKYRGGPPCFWEIYHGDPVTGTILQRLTHRLDGGIVLHKGFFATAKTSYVTNLDTAYFGAAVWPTRVCRDLRANAADYLEAEPSTTAAPIFHKPSNMECLRILFKVAGRSLARRLRGFLRDDQWNVGVVDQPIEAFVNGPLPAVTWLPTPTRRSRFLADPFGAKIDGRLVILAEDFDYRMGKGWLAAVERRDDGGFSAPRGVLELDVHLSYPFLLHHEGQWYCIPESHQAGEVALFKADSFPDRWQKVATLIPDFPALDPTVFQHDGLWWLLCSRIETTRGWSADDADMKLYAFWAEDLFGPWHPHATNPLKTDVRSSRPAGTPFLHQGQLYRPAQDVSITYGGRVAINRVSRLTRSRFEEQVVRVLEPFEGPYGDGFHHLASVGDVTLVDGKRKIFMPETFAVKLARKLGF